MKITIAYDFVPKQRSLNACRVMDLFGVGFDQGRHVVAENVELEPKPGDVLLFTGPSGSGKSSLLRAVAEQLAGYPEADASGSPAASVVWLDQLELPDRPLADALPLSFREAMDLLAACGLGEAQLLLRRPAELSEGQRYRFRLAFGLAQLAATCQGKPCWLVADEFTATLDRTLAQVLAFNLARLVRRHGIGLLVATTHDDVALDLAPDLHIRCDLDGRVAVERPERQPRRAISFFLVAGSASAPRPTGRTSLGGITAATTCRRPARSFCSGMKTGPSASASSRPRRRRSGSGTSSSARSRAQARST